MPRAYAYPPDLARFVEVNWPGEGGLKLLPGLLEEALGIAFQASFMQEETRQIRFRLLLAPPEQFPENGSPRTGVLRLSFDESRPFTPDELRRLAPAVPFEMSLIGVWGEPGKLRIWGVAHSGPAWLAPTWGGRAPVPIWSSDPIVHVTGPGQLAVRCAGKLVGAIERGQVVDAALDVFEAKWLPTMFEREREDIRAIHAATQAGVDSPTLVEHSLVGKVGQQMLRRAIQLVRGARHGGLFLVVRTEAGTEAALRGVKIKYCLAQDEPSQRYRSLLLRILETVAASTTKESVGWADFASSDSPAFAQLERDVFELSRVMANLGTIDGALVLDTRFGILGFGAEVSPELPTPPQVFRALDVEATELVPESIENVGTRHRAAYRFANEHPDGLAVVVSQDGAVTFVASRDGKVVVWEQSVGP